MGCKCQEAAHKAFKELRIPALDDAYPPNEREASISRDEIFRAGMRTGLLWAASKATHSYVTTLGQRVTGVVNGTFLRTLAEAVKEDGQVEGSGHQPDSKVRR